MYHRKCGSHFARHIRVEMVLRAAHTPTDWATCPTHSSTLRQHPTSLHCVCRTHPCLPLSHLPPNRRHGFTSACATATATATATPRAALHPIPSHTRAQRPACHVWSARAGACRGTVGTDGRVCVCVVRVRVRVWAGGRCECGVGVGARVVWAVRGAVRCVAWVRGGCGPPCGWVWFTPWCACVDAGRMGRCGCGRGWG